MCDNLISIEDDSVEEELVSPRRKGVFAETVRIPLDTINSNSTYIKEIPAVSVLRGGYQVIGVAGFSIVSTSQLSIFRLRVQDDIIHIGLRNNTKKPISGKKLEIDLLVRCL